MLRSENTRTYSSRRQCFSICRFCAAKLDKNKLLDLTQQDNSLTYNQMISFLKLEVDISDNNVLPKAICTECHTKFCECYNFFLSVIETQEKLSLKFNNATKDMQQGCLGFKNKNTPSIITSLPSKHISANTILSHALESTVCSLALPNTTEIPGSHVETNIQHNVDSSPQPCGSQTYSNNINIDQTYMDPLQTILEDVAIEYGEFKTTFNAVSNDLSRNIDAIENIDSGNFKPILQNIVSEAEESQTNFREDTHVAQNNDHQYSRQIQNITNVEEKNNNLDYPQTKQNKQPKHRNNTSPIGVNDEKDKSIPYTKHNKNQYDVKIEDAGGKINATPEQLPETDNSSPTNHYVANDIFMDMEAVSSIDHIEVKSEIVHDKDNCDFRIPSPSKTNDLVHIDLDMSDNDKRGDAVEKDPLENIELVERGIKTEILNDDCFENNDDSDTSAQHFEEDNPLASNEDKVSSDTLCLNNLRNPVISESSSPTINNSFLKTLLNRTADTIENLRQIENVDVGQNNASDAMTSDSHIANKDIAEKNYETVQNVVLLNNSNSNNKFTSRNTFKHGQSHKATKSNEQNVTLLNSMFSKATCYATSNAKIHKLTKINKTKTCTLRGTKINNSNNVTILNKGYLAVAHGHSANVGQHGKVIKGNNVTLLKSSNSKTNSKINTTEIDNSTKGNNLIHCKTKVTKENNQNVILLNKNKTINTLHGKRANNDLKGKVKKNPNDFLSVTVDGNTLLLQYSNDSESLTVEKGPDENDSTSLNHGKATSNDKNIDNKDDHNDVNRKVNDEDNSNLNKDEDNLNNNTGNLNNDDDKLNNDKGKVNNDEDNLNNVDDKINNDEDNLNNDEESSKSDSDKEETSKSTKPWRFDHDDVAENDFTKTSILWKTKYVYNSTLKSDISRIVEHYAEVTAEKEIAKIDPDNEYLVEKSWVTYPWLCDDCNAVFDNVEDLRGHKQYVHKRCCGFLCVDCKIQYQIFEEFIEHVRLHRYYLRLICEYCNRSFPDVTSCINHTSTHQAPYKTCPSCGEEFRDSTKLRAHRWQYKVKSTVCPDKDPAVAVSGKKGTWKDYEWRCLECSKLEQDLKSLRAHVREVHKKCFAVKCADCPRDPIQSLNAFARHVRLHRPYLRYYCHHCDEHFSNFVDLASHIDRHFSLEHVCLRCGECFPDESHLKQHVKQYSPKEKHLENRMVILCHFCGKQISGQSNFVTHLKLHEHWSTVETCDVCSKTFRFKRALILHANMHKTERPFICDYCNMAFKTKKCVKKHILTHSEIKPYVCLVCDKRFLRHFQLKQHSPVHNIIEWNEKKYICDYCGNTYKSRKGLSSHLAKHINNEKNETCKICDKKFLLKSALRTHAKTHVKEKPYTCDYCQKTFKSKNNIRVHIMSHIGVKKHECLVCGKRFRLKCNFTVHVRTHTDFRPYHCEKCDRKFKDCPSCDKHMVNAHGMSFFKTKITEIGRVEIDRQSGETRSLTFGEDAMQWLRDITGGRKRELCRPRVRNHSEDATGNTRETE